MAEIEAARKATRDKQADKRLHAVLLRGEGLSNPEIAAKLDTSYRVVSRWVSAYSKNGVSALMGGKYGGNRRNMSFAAEAELLAEFKALAEKGQLVEVSAIIRGKGRTHYRRRPDISCAAPSRLAQGHAALKASEESQ